MIAAWIELRVLVTIGCLTLPACGTVVEPKLAPGWSAADAAQPITHADCVRLALRFAPNAASWQARLDAAQVALDQASCPPNPLLGFAAEGFGWFQSVPAAALTTTVSLGMELDRLFSTSRREEAARFDLAATRADLEVERRRLAIEVCRAYDRLVDSRGRAALDQEIARTAAEQATTARALVIRGFASEFEALRSEAEAAQAQADAFAAQTQARARELAFVFALGFREPVQLRLADGLPAPGGAPARDPAELLRKAVDERPELKATSARYAAALSRAHLEASGSRFLPSVALGVQPSGGRIYGSGAIEVELPVFDDGSALEAASAAELLAAAAAARRAAQQVSGEVIETGERLFRAGMYLEDHVRPLVALRERVDVAAAQQAATGGVSVTEWLQARRDEADARRALLAAELAWSELSWNLDVDALIAEVGL